MLEHTVASLKMNIVVVISMHFNVFSSYRIIVVIRRETIVSYYDISFNRIGLIVIY